MSRRIISAALAGLLVTNANAGALFSRGRTASGVAPDPITQFSVFNGPQSRAGVTCVQPIRALTSKTWYFAVSPLDGKTPAAWATYFAANPLDLGAAGDSNHPLYPIQNLFNFGSFPFTQEAGWTHPLDGTNIYFGLPNNTVHQSFKDYASLVIGDTTHSYLWPGDEVVLRGRAGVNAGVWTIAGSPGTASPLGGAASKGLTEVDGVGNPLHVYIHSDPAYPRPVFQGINRSSVVGSILQGLNVYNTYTGYQTTDSSRYMNWGTAQPTDGMWLNLGEHVVTWRNTPVLTDDVKIGSTWQRSLINAAENFQNSADPNAHKFTITTQQSNATLVEAITTQPTNGQTIDVNGVTWTFVSGTPTSNQVQIGANLAATLTSAAAAFKASTLAAMKVYANYIAAATSLSFVYQPAAQPASGSTLELNGHVWTFVTGTPAANQIQISPTNTAATIWETLGNAVEAFDAAGATPWGTGVTYTSNGAGLLMVSKTVGLPGIFKTQSTFHQADADTNINLSTWGLGGTYGFRDSGTVAGPSHDNIIDDMLITSWDGVLDKSLATAPQDLYPSTGSLGVNLDPTDLAVPYGSVDPAKVGGPWNAYDWTLIPNLTGLSLNGTLAAGTDNTEDNNYCEAVTNTGSFYTGTAMGIGQVHDTLMQDVVANYNGNDQFDSYSNDHMYWNRWRVFNPINNGQAFHPDAMQVGVVGANFGVQWGNVFNAGIVMPATDPTIVNDPGWTDMNGGTKNLGGGPQGILANGAIHHDITATNNLIITTACVGISVEVVPNGSTDIEGNTLLWPGEARGGVGRCSNTPNIVPHVRPDTLVTETIKLVNNVAHSYAFGGSSAICPLPANVTILNNKIVKMSTAGSYLLPVSAYCPNGGNPASPTKPVIGPPPNSIFDGGVTYAGDGDPSLSFMAYPMSNILGDGRLLNLHPLPGGYLDATGAATSLCCNVDGDTRASPPNIGAY